jgi:ribonuclease P protein component
MLRFGRRHRTTHLELRARDCPEGHARVGFVVPKYGHSSVQRNRLKRRLREIVRQKLLMKLCKVDVVIRARPEAYRASFATLLEEVIEGVMRLTASLGR